MRCSWFESKVCAQSVEAGPSVTAVWAQVLYLTIFQAIARVLAVNHVLACLLWRVWCFIFGPRFGAHI